MPLPPPGSELHALMTQFPRPGTVRWIGLRPDGTLLTHKLLSEDPTHYEDAALAGIRREVPARPGTAGGGQELREGVLRDEQLRGRQPRQLRFHGGLIEEHLGPLRDDLGLSHGTANALPNMVWSGGFAVTPLIVAPIAQAVGDPVAYALAAAAVFALLGIAVLMRARARNLSLSH